MALMSAGVAAPTTSTEPDASAQGLRPPGESPSDSKRMPVPLKNPRVSAIRREGRSRGRSDSE